MFKLFFTLLLLVVVGTTTLNSQNAGSLDPTFNQTGILEFTLNGRKTAIYDMALLSDGKILVTGYAFHPVVTYFPYVFIARLNSDGTLDTSFGDNGAFKSENASQELMSVGHKIIVQEDGKILLIADRAAANSYVFYRLMPNGTLDHTFNNTGFREESLPIWNPTPFNAEVLPDGKIMVYGQMYSNNRFGVLASRFLPDGTTDPSFANDGHFFIYSSDKSHVSRDGAVLPDGKILLPHSSGSTPTDALWHVTRLLPNGQLDPEFGTNGMITLNLGGLSSEIPYKIILFPDGRFIVAGHGQKLPGYHFTLVRFLANGSVDNSFGFNGKAQVMFDCCFSNIYDISIQADGKIVACGYQTANNAEVDVRFAIARLNANGSVDNSFGTEGKAIITFDPALDKHEAWKIQIQPDNKILVSGFSMIGNSINKGLIVRLDAGTVLNTNVPQQQDYALAAFPNPMGGGGLLQIEYSLPEPMPVSIYLTDLVGQRIAQHHTRGEMGSNVEAFMIPASLPPGLYSLSIETPVGSQSHQLVKTSR